MTVRRPRPIFLALLALALVLFALWWRAGRALQLDAIDLPAGFTIHLYADSVPDARSLALGERGTVFVGTREDGRVFALVDADRNGRAERIFTIARDLPMPNGVAFREGSLYVALVNRVIRFDSIEDRLATPPEPVTVFDSLPGDAYHGWKFIRFGPDGRLYVPVGAPCNTCLPEDTRHASILSILPDGSDLRIEATGVRNTVGFDWDPATGDMWFTDNGRDWMGENEPPDELNHRPGREAHFGFPHCYGRSTPDPDYPQRSCAEVTPATVELGAHVAALGMRFYRGNRFPPRFRNRIFIAEHGSWNRVIASGYRVTTVRRTATGFEYEVFASGWEKLNRSWGRPVDIMELPDGSLLISDDRAGAVYRVTSDQTADH